MSKHSISMARAMVAAGALLFLAAAGTSQEVNAQGSSSLEPGQWTARDRIVKNERFRAAMEHIATHDRTDLLGTDHERLACYYAYLADHPIVLQIGARWPSLAAEVVRMVGVADFGGSALDATAGLLTSLLRAEEPPRLSAAARTFVDGTVSAVVAADVTRRFFGPLLRSEIPLPEDRFLFDADTLRSEQLHPDVVSSYASFTDTDRRLLDNRLARWYASESWTETEQYDLTSARDRIFLGLRKMGYDEARIEAYLEQHDLAR